MPRPSPVSALRMAAAALLLPIASDASEPGTAIYQSRCLPCHQAGGVGAPGLAPPLAGVVGAYVANEAGRAYLAQVVVFGLNGPIRSQAQPFNAVMPPLAVLSDEEIAAVLNFVLSDFNRALLPAQHRPLTAGEVAAVRNRAPSMRDLRQMHARLAGETK
ncbi:MAG: cytochrome C-552 [Rhodocyclaceae bacterium]